MANAFYSSLQSDEKLLSYELITIFSYIIMNATKNICIVYLIVVQYYKICTFFILINFHEKN